MVVGPAVVLVCTRGQSPVRLLFNLAQFGLTAALATITLHAIAPAPAAIGPAVWGATFVAVLAASATAAVLVFCAIGLSEGSIPSRKLAGMLGADMLVALTNTSVALAGATVVANDLTAGWLLLPPAAVLLLAYRAWVSERAKHQSLEFLYGVTRSLSRGGELEAELLDLLRRTRSSFRVQTAELVVLPGPDVGALRTARGQGGHEEVMVPVAHAAAGALRAAVEHDGAVRVERERCSAELRQYLTERGIEQALIAPVRGETKLAGVMVLGDRIGATDSFTDEDLRLFEALAAHAGLSLELDRLERQAQSDPLTGLANRTLFLRRVEASLERGSGMATVLFLDLDDFKAINDAPATPPATRCWWPPPGGSRRRSGRATSRPGWAATSSPCSWRTSTITTASRWRAASSTCWPSRWWSTARSCGCAPRSASPPRLPGSLGSGELLHRADVAMYRAKEAGKSQMRVWFPEMEAAGDGAPTGRDELSDALRRGELVAHFQPIVSLVDGSDVAYEALARWRHPRLGLLGAGSFVPDAEGDLAAAVDREVLFQACARRLAGRSRPST